METKQIGVIYVDSGKLMLVDPLNLDNWTGSETSRDTDFSYAAIARKVAQTLTHQSTFEAGHEGLALTLACNDGEYPVMAHTEDGAVRKIWIDFD